MTLPPLDRAFRRGLCLLLLCLGSPLAAAPAEPAGEPEGSTVPRYVLGLSPFLDRTVKDDVYRQAVQFLLEEVPLASTLWLCDAYHLQTIAKVDVPGLAAFRSAKTRANQFREPIRKLRDFLATTPEPAANAPALPNQALRLPQFLDFVAESLGTHSHPTVVILLGNPLYVDAKEPEFSMRDGYFPSDGHLRANRETSVYGLQGRGASLHDVRVHFGWFGDPWVSEVHRDRVQRFWTLYLQEQGGRMATFCGDLPTVFEQARHSTPGPLNAVQRVELNPAQVKPEMLRITRTVGANDWITRDNLTHVNLGPPSRTVGVLKIGIRWQGNLDLDLYARPTPDAETLFFEHTRSPEGYYFKDHRSSPDREYEFIEFETPVDVWQLEARVNFYAGATPGGPTGEVRVEFDNRIYSGTFRLEAAHGNQGRDGRTQGACWTSLDLPGLLHLRDRLPAERAHAATRPGISP